MLYIIIDYLLDLTKDLTDQASSIPAKHIIVPSAHRTTVQTLVLTEMYESIQIPNQFQFNSTFFVSFELNLKQKKPR